MNRSRFLALAGAGAVFSSAAFAQTLVAPDADSTRILRSPPGHTLTPPSTGAHAGIVAALLRRNGRDAATVASLRVAGEQRTASATHLRMAQEVGGLRVYGSYVKAAFNDSGAVFHLMENIATVTPVGVLPAKVDDAQALNAALRTLYPNQVFVIAARGRSGNTATFSAGAFFHRSPTVTAMALPMSDNVLRAGYLVETWSQARNQLNHTVVGGDGRVLYVEKRTNTDAYNVFVEDPLKGAQTVVSGPGAGNAQSPAGWLGAGPQSSINITGNNTHTYLDTDANNAADAGGSAVADGNFLTAADLAASPSTPGNQAVAAQNLFYLNNTVHDTLYRHGFDEAAGNFQSNNFGLGGAGNDAVNAEAQDGSGLDNANFATPTDGSAPRMQMYLWSGSTPTAIVGVNGNDYGAYASSFGPALSLSGVAGLLAVYSDGVAPASDGCEASLASLSGRIAIVDRGTCNFTDKVLNAQKAGAIGVVIVNNVAGSAFGPGGTSNRVRIPSAMVGLADGPTLKALAGASATLHQNPAPPLRLDGDVDADIVFHEYGHGLTWRMIGGMSGKLSGAIGEGAADVNAFLMNGDDVIGEYSFADTGGIRRYRYEGYPLTYSAVTGAEVHDDGEIYAAAMWKVLREYQNAGLTADDLHGDFVGGMNFTPASPAFEDMRDGMLQQVAGTGRECMIWRGFAAAGVGVGADGRLSRSGRNVTIVESFALPASCQ